MVARRGYSAVQIGLHWLIVVLVLFQLVFGESMGALFRAQLRGEPLPADAALGEAHIWVGFAILAAVTLRLVLRLVQGAPPPAEGSALTRRLAGATHLLFYVLLFAAPILGILAYWWQPELGEVHELAKPAFIVLIILHVAGALYHQFVKRDDVLMRMSRPAS